MTTGRRPGSQKWVIAPTTGRFVRIDASSGHDHAVRYNERPLRKRRFAASMMIECPLSAEYVDYPDLVAGALRVHASVASSCLAMHHRQSAVRRPRGWCARGQCCGGRRVCASARSCRDNRGLSPRVNLNQHLNLVTVDFIGGDGAVGSIPCLEDDDRDHERGGE